MDPHNDKALASPEALDYWSPVDWYNGGMEHTTLHLLYSRFWHKFLYDIGVVPTKEPYAEAHEPRHDPRRGRRKDVQVPRQRRQSERHRRAVRRGHACACTSCSSATLKRPRRGRQAVKGCKRFLDRCWNLMDMAADSEEITPANESTIHKTIRKVTQDIDELKMNTAIAALMTLVNEFYANGLSRGDLKILMLLLSPFAPHMVEEMWELTGYAEKSGKMAMQMPWPQYDESKTVDETVQMAVQVLGKLKGTISVPMDSDEKAVVDAAMALEKIGKICQGKQLVKTILVKNKLVNLIVK
jgi:leucyl-tRNA synthetase